MSKKTKLELTWIGKKDRVKLEPRILLEDKFLSYSVASKPKVESDMPLIPEEDAENTAPTFDNKVIFGDNLLALKALEQEYTGKVKYIYIDPPYNTGNAFEHYDEAGGIRTPEGIATLSVFKTLDEQNDTTLNN